MPKFLKLDLTLKGMLKVLKGLFYLLGEIFWQIFTSPKLLKRVFKVKNPLNQFRIRGLPPGPPAGTPYGHPVYGSFYRDRYKYPMGLSNHLIRLYHLHYHH